MDGAPGDGPRSILGAAGQASFWKRDGPHGQIEADFCTLKRESEDTLRWDERDWADGRPKWISDYV
jgi:hypothetical protein